MRSFLSLLSPNTKNLFGMERSRLAINMPIETMIVNLIIVFSDFLPQLSLYKNALSFSLKTGTELGVPTEVDPEEKILQD